jgi:hypothetical protein
VTFVSFVEVSVWEPFFGADFRFYLISILWCCFFDFQMILADENRY